MGRLKSIRGSVKAFPAFRIAALCALALCFVYPDACAFEAKVLFGTGLSINGITFTPHAFNLNWNGFGALGRPDLDAAAGVEGADSPSFVRHFTLNTGAADDSPVFSGTGTFYVGGGSGAESPPFVRAEWRVTADKAGRFAQAFVSGDVPFSRIGGGTAILDGVELPIPAKRGQASHLFNKSVSSIELRGPDGATILRVSLDEPTTILLQDNRHWKNDDLGIRFFFAIGSCEAGKEYSVKAKFSGGDSGAEPTSLVIAEPVRIVAGPDWLPLAAEPWIVPGSALDFSTVIPHHTPAGKFGRVVVRGDHFEFENLPGVTQRFYGVNLCGTANMPRTAEEAERFTVQLARMGYNTVRIHHHEKWLVSKDGVLESSASADGTDIDPALMDKLDLLVASCVKQGIYLTTDLFVSRSHVVPWRSIGIDLDGPVPPDKYKLLCAFWEPAFTNLCDWSRKFMLHKNSYTGRTLAEEPALATLALINEGNLGNYGATALRDLPGVQETWRKWLSAKSMEAGFSEIPDGIPDSLVTSTSGDTPYNRHVAAFAIFLAEMETRLYERLGDFIRDELHCPVPLSNLSGWYDPVQSALPRSMFDYIDVHFYVDHPQFLGKSWRLPSRCPNVNPMRGPSQGVQECVWRRQMDKPFCITEFNYSAPGRFRGVGGIATGAIAALQDWGGIWRFAWSHSIWGIVSPGGRTGYFDLANDPLSLAAERAALCLFLRGDIAPLEAEDPLLLSEASLRNPANGAPKLATLGENARAWSSRVGTRLSGSSSLSGNLSREATPKPRNGDLNGKAAHKAVSIAADGTFLIETPCTAGGFAESGTHTAGPLRFKLLPSSDDTQTVAAATVWVSSLDGKPIAQSSHLLLTHLTDVQNSGIEYADPNLTILLDWGKLPHLMRRGAAHIELSLAKTETPAPNPSLVTRHSSLGGGNVVAATVYRLSPGGRRLGEVPAEIAGSDGPASQECRLRFTARTDLDPTTATYLYEIVRERSAP